VPALRPGLAGIVAVELAAVATLRVSMLTRYSPRVDPALDPAVISPASGAGRPVGRNAGSATGSGSPETAPPQGPTLSAMRGLGRMVAGAQTRLPDAQVALEAGARRAGGHAGRLQRAWRRAGR
jgi:hypothetical protein